jgi:hypothetical protein
VISGGGQGKELIKAIENLMTRRGELVDQPPSFFSHDSMFEKAIFQAYSTSRENTLGVLKRQVQIFQEDNDVDCN